MSLLTAYYYTSNDTKIQYIYLLAEITLKLGLQSTEAYIIYAFFCFFYYHVRSVLFKIHAANIEASKFFVKNSCC